MSSENVLVQLTLAELMDQAEAASGLDRIDFRDPIAAHGLEAIEAVLPWLDGPLAWFAVAVIERAGMTGHKRTARRVLRSSLGAASPEVRLAVRAALARLGERPMPAGPVLPRGVMLAPGRNNPSAVHHVVVDRLERGGSFSGDVYLFECGWAFSGRYVRECHGPVVSTGQPICEHCLQAMERGR
jgi:hypothetical protein